MNIFEGGRRASKAVIAVWSVMVFVVCLTVSGITSDVWGIFQMALILFIPPLLWVPFVYLIGYVVRGLNGIEAGRDK